MAAEYFKDLQRIANRLNQLDHADLAGKMREDLDAISRLGLKPGEVGIDHPIQAVGKISDTEARVIRREYKSFYPIEKGEPTHEELLLSLDAMRVMNHARTEGSRLLHNYIGTEHILLGLLSDPLSPVAQILAHPEEDGHERREKQHEEVLNLSKARSAVEFIIGMGDRMVYGSVALTPRSRKVIEIARTEAKGREAKEVDCLDLLVGLVREGAGIGVGVLESAGFDELKREKLVQRIRESRQ